MRAASSLFSHLLRGPFGYYIIYSEIPAHMKRRGGGCVFILIDVVKVLSIEILLPTHTSID